MLSNLEQVDQTTRFVGRETELSELNRLLQSPTCRLLTLVGVGGTGKTRLAIELARRQQSLFPHGVWFVNLQPLQSGKQIAVATMDAMGVVPSGRDTPENQLLQYLAGKQALLLIDNFEHVLDGVSLLPHVMKRAPEIKLLVTSREALSLPEEWLYPVEGLPTPPSYQTDELEDVTAVKLFMERAHQVRPDFALKDDQAGVVRICQLVEGLPLALEIAASWTKTLRCSEIAAEIQRNLNFLTSNLRHGPTRHRSMQAVFSQTWDRLSEEEQHLFKRLAVFKGGFQREAAEVIAGATLPLLSSLLDKCLLRRDADGRYQIHELLRQYGDRQLDTAEAEAVAQAHTDYYCNFLISRGLGLAQQKQVQYSLEVEAELENIRAAWQYAVDHQKLDLLKQAAGPFFSFCQMQSRYLEYVEASSQVVTRLEAVGDEAGMAQVLVYQGWMLIRIGRFPQAEAGLARSRALFEAYQLPTEYSMGSHPLSPSIVLMVIQGDYNRAVALGEQLKQLFSSHTNDQNLAFASYGLTSAYLNLGNYETALENAEAALALFVEIGNHWLTAYVHIELGNVYRALGQYGQAEYHYRQGLRVRQDYKDPEGIAVTAIHLGEISLLQNDFLAARQLYEQSLAIYEKLNDQGGLANAHQGLGLVASRTGAVEMAANHFREALDIAAKINFVPLLLSLLIDVGFLMLSNGRQQRGSELLRLVYHHPAGNQRQQSRAAALLERPTLNDNIPLPDLKSTITALQTELRGFVPTPPSANSLTLVEPLTERELDILRLIDQGLSNPAIAARLVISVGTVKAHTNRIYGKLGVINRVEAITKARTLGLLVDRD